MHNSSIQVCQNAQKFPLLIGLQPVMYTQHPRRLRGVLKVKSPLQGEMQSRAAGETWRSELHCVFIYLEIALLESLQIVFQLLQTIVEGGEFRIAMTCQQIWAPFYALIYFVTFPLCVCSTFVLKNLLAQLVVCIISTFKQ